MLSWTPYTWRVRSSVVGRWHWWNYDWQARCWFTRLIFKCLFCVWRLALETDLKIEREWRGTLQQNLDKEKAKVAKLQTDIQHLEETKKVAQSYHFYHVCSASEESAEKACVYRELYNGQSFSLAEMIQTDLPSTPRSTHSSSVVTLSCPPTISSLKITYRSLNMHHLIFGINFQIHFISLVTAAHCRISQMRSSQRLRPVAVSACLAPSHASYHGPELVWATGRLMSLDRGMLPCGHLTVSANSEDSWKKTFLSRSRLQYLVTCF